MYLIKTIAATLVVLVIFALLLTFFYEVELLPINQTLHYDAFLTIMLTALGVMVAIFAILVGLAAIWGYAGFRDIVRDMATKEVATALTETLKKYPKASDMFSLLKRLEEHADWYDKLRNEAVTAPESESRSSTSNIGIQEVQGETPLDSVTQQATPIETYPGEEHKDVNSGDEPARS